MTPTPPLCGCRIGYIPTNPQFPRGMTPISYLDYIDQVVRPDRAGAQDTARVADPAVDLLNVSGDHIDGFLNA